MIMSSPVVPARRKTHLANRINHSACSDRRITPARCDVIDTIVIVAKIAYMIWMHCSSHQTPRGSIVRLSILLEICFGLLALGHFEAVAQTNSGQPGVLEDQLLKEEPKKLADEA